ncbi:hypothetical protein M5D96_003239, partial [Drosophila gunungcola]
MSANAYVSSVFQPRKNIKRGGQMVLGGVVGLKANEGSKANNKGTKQNEAT